MKRYCLVTVALLVGGAGLFLMSARLGNRRQAEPTFCGRHVTQWLTSRDFETNRPAVSLAVLAFGEKAVPTLKRMLHSGNKMERIWFRLAPRSWYRRFPVGGYQFDRKDRAMWALQTLGRAGREAIPDLVAILQDPTEHWNQRSRAISTLRDVRAEPALLIPVLDKLTNDAVMKVAAGTEVQLLRRQVEMDRQREAGRAIRASLSPPPKLPNPEFHPSTSFLSGLSLSAPKRRESEWSLGAKEPLPSPDVTGSHTTNRSLHAPGVNNR